MRSSESGGIQRRRASCSLALSRERCFYAPGGSRIAMGWAAMRNGCRYREEETQ